MKIANGIDMLEITAQVMGGSDTLYPVLLHDEDTAVLIDTGYPGLLEHFKAAFETAGVPWSKLKTIILTHQDLDHIGSLPAILESRAGGALVLAHALEKPHIEGDKMLLKHTPEAIAAAEAMLPPHVPEEWRQAFLSVLKHPPKGKVDSTLSHGQRLPLAGGLTVIHTPGHSPGHLCLYHHPSRTLIAGDALTVREGELHGPDTSATPDMPAALASLAKLADYPVDAVICYHGGLYRGSDASRRIAELSRGQQ